MKGEIWPWWRLEYETNITLLLFSCNISKSSSWRDFRTLWISNEKLSWGFTNIKLTVLRLLKSSFFTNIFPSVGNLDSESQKSMARPMMLPEFHKVLTGLNISKLSSFQEHLGDNLIFTWCWEQMLCRTYMCSRAFPNFSSQHLKYYLLVYFISRF